MRVKDAWQTTSGWLYRGKAWLENLAGTRYAQPALFLTAFIEASLFPVPPDVLFVALGIARPRRSFLYGFVCIVGSTLGGMTGYAIGRYFFEGLGNSLIGLTGLHDQVGTLLSAYHDHAWWTILTSGFTNLPFSLFSITAGFRGTLDPVTFFFAALTGRSIRFLIVATLLYFVGPQVKGFIDRWLPAIAFCLLGLFIAVVIGVHFISR